MPAPTLPPVKLPKNNDKLPVPKPQPTSERKREPKLLAVINPVNCFGRGCEFCIAVCPVPDCITLTTDPQAPELDVCTVNFDTCIGCLHCRKQTLSAYLHRNLIVLGFVSEGSGHTAASRRDLLHFIARGQTEQGEGWDGSYQRLLVAMTM